MERRIRCGGKPMTVIVLAGGLGRRMNADKARLPVPGGTLLGRVLGQVGPLFDEVLVSVSPGQNVDLGAAQVTNTPPSRRSGVVRAASGGKAEKENRFQSKIIRDELPGLGPMAGILACLKAAANDACAVVACDIPDIDAPLLRELARAAAEAEIAVPITPKGNFEPLFAVYRKAVIPEIEELLRTGERSLLPLFGRCRTAVLRLEDASWLRNLNTREDYESYILSLAAGKMASAGTPKSKGQFSTGGTARPQGRRPNDQRPGRVRRP
jgi:molybdopterin-guanine dinucleotide biosynthesis protein A